MKTKSLFAAIFGFLAAIALNSTAFAQVNLLTNGDFSANALSFTTFPGGLGGANPATITGWTYTSAGGGAGINGVGISTPFGPANQTAVTYYAFEQNGGTLSQNIPTIVASHAYVLDYFAASRSGQNAPLTVLIKDSAITYTTSSFIGSNAAFVRNAQYFASPAAITGTPLIQLTNTTGGPDVTGDFGKVGLFDGTGVWSGQVSGALGGPSVNFHGQTFAQAAAASGGTLQFNGTTVAGGIVSNTLLTTAAGGVSTGTLAFNNTGADYAVLSSDASGISGATAITKAGSGTLMLGGTHTYSGTTTISGGTLVAGGAFALNGTFEYPAFGPGGWSYAPAGATWAFTGAGVARNGSPWVNTAPEGLQAAFIQNNGTMNETFVAGAAGTYTMTFQAANRPAYPDSGITVQIDGGTVATFAPGTFNSGGAFNTFTIGGLNLTQGTHTINFIGTQQGADSATAIDRIRFNGNVSGSIPSTNAVNLTASGATLDLNGTNQTLGSLAGVAGSKVIDDRSLTVGGSNTNTTFAGVISGAGTVTKTGTGTLTLSGNNTFTGSLTLNANSGTVVLSGNNSARPANVSGLTTINSGSTLQLQANAGNTTGAVSTALSSEQTANQPLVLNNGGTLQLRSDSDVIFAGGNNFGGLGAASVTIDVNQINAGNLNHTLAIAPGGFSVGQTTLNVTGGNGYTLGLGKITQVGAGDGSLTLNPTTANVAIAAIDKGASNFATNVQGSGNTIVGPISGTGAVNKSGTGTLILGAPSTYTGPTTITSGTVQLAATPAAPSLGNGNFEAPILLGNSHTYYNAFSGAQLAAFTWTAGGNAVGGGSGPALVNNSAAWAYSTPYPSPNQALSLQSTSFITQSLNFTAPGYFTLNWSAASRSGQTNPYNVLVDGVSVGSFSTNNTAWNANTTTPFLINSAGSHTISFAGTTAADQSVGLDNISITPLGGNLPSTTAVNINGATGVLNLNSRAQTIGSLAGVAGSQVINNNSNLTTGGDNTSTSFAGVISGSGSVTKSGTGTWTVSGANNYTGATNIANGTEALGASNSLPTGTTVALGDTAAATTGILKLDGNNQTIAGLTTAGTNANNRVVGGNATTSTLTLNIAGTNAFGGVLGGPGANENNLNVTKNGAGTMILANTNTYTGNTVINAGTLKLAGAADSPAVPNGTFEAPIIAGNSFVYYTTQMSGAQQSAFLWTGGGTVNGPALVNNSAAWGYTQPYPSPNQAVSLQQTSTLTQSINFATPGYFTLNWSAASRGGQVNPYNVQVDGVTIGSFSTGSTTWSPVSAPFLITTAGNHIISFIGTSVPDNSVGLDSVSIASSAGLLPSATAVSMPNAGAVLDLGGNNQTIGSLAGVAGSSVINNNNLTTGGLNTSTTYAGVISGTGSLTKTGTGTFTVTGLNTYTGVTDISQGTLNVGTFSNYGVAGGMGARTAAQETAAGDGIGIHIGSGTTGATLQYTGATAQSTNREIRISAANNSIDASGSNPAATLSFTHTGPNVNLFDTPGARTLTLTGSNTGPNSFSIQLTNEGASQTTLAKTGAGRWLIANSDNTYTGETIIGGGILNVASVSDYGVASSIGARTAGEENGTITGIGLHFQGGTLQYTGSTPQSTNRQIRMLNGNGATIDASGSNPAATLSFTYNAANTNLFDTPGTRTLTLTGTNTGDNLFAIRLTDEGASATSVTKTAAGTWVLSNPNSSYTGATLVQGGTLKVTANNALGSNAGSTTVSNGARLFLANTLYTTTETLNLNGAGIGAAGTDGALFATGASRWDGNINVQTNSTIFAPVGATLALGNSGSPGTIDKNNTTLTFDGGGTFTVNSQITGVTDHTSDLNVTGNSTVILTNVNNSFMGPINIQSGTLKLGASNVVPNGTEVKFGGVGPNYIFDMANGGSNFNDTVRGLSSVAAGNGITRNSQAGTNSILTLAPQGVETWVYSGNIEKNPGTINLVLNGSSTARQQLSGTNDVSGLAVATSGGTLQITGGTTQVTGTGGITPTPGGANMLPANNVAPLAGTTADVNSSGHLIVNNGAAFTLSGGLLDFRDYATGTPSNHKPNDIQRSMIQVNGTGAFNFTGGTLRDVSVIGLPAVGGGTLTQNGASTRFVIGQDMIGPGATTTVNGNYTLVSGVLAFDIFGPPVAPEDAYSILDPNDRLDVHGTVTLNGTLEINFPGFNPLFHQDWNVITSDNPIVLQPGFGVSGAFYRIVPIGGGGNGQALQVYVPEPGTIALWSLVGLAAGGYAMRRRIRRA